MNLKAIGIFAAVMIIIAVAGGVTWKLSQRTEGYKASGNQYFVSPEPRFGCATAKVYFYGGKCDKPGSDSVSDNK